MPEGIMQYLDHFSIDASQETELIIHEKKKGAERSAPFSFS
jgi:hypothetical protein